MLCLLVVQVCRKRICNIIRRNLCFQAPQFTEPQLRLHIEERTRMYCVTDSGMRDKSEQCVNRSCSIRKCRQSRIFRYKTPANSGSLHIFVCHQREQVLGEAVIHQHLTQCQSCFNGVDIVGGIGEPSGCRCTQIALLIVVFYAAKQRGDIVTVRHTVVCRVVTGKKFVGRQSVLRDDRVLFKCLTEHLLRVLSHTGG